MLLQSRRGCGWEPGAGLRVHQQGVLKCVALYATHFNHPSWGEFGTIVRAGCAAVLGYWAEGLAGLPVFAGAPHASAAVFAGPTGGFLFGFLPAAVLTGWLAEKGWDRNNLTALAAMMLGTLLLYAFGTPWFALFATSISQAGEVTRNGLGWSSTWQYAVQPFLIGDVVKMLAAALIFPELWQRVKR